MESAEFEVKNLPEYDNAHLNEELQACQNFLVDIELEKGRHRVYNFAMSSLDNSLINKNLGLVLNGLKCAAKVKHALGFVLKYAEDGSCRYFYAHENSTVIERSKLVCTPDDITNLKEKIQKVDVVDLCTRERANTKWKFYKLTNLTVFAALLKDVPMGCKDSALPEALLKNQNVKCLTFEKKYKKALQWQSVPFQSSCSAFIWLREIGWGNIQIFQPPPEQLWGSRSIKVPGCSHDRYSKSGGDVATQYFPYDFDFVDGELIGELARRSNPKFEKSAKLLRYNNHIYYVHMNSFKSFRCSTCDTIFLMTGILERQLITCREQVKHIYPKNVYQLRGTFFEKVNSFKNLYKEDQKLFKNMAVFDFESICVEVET